MKTKWRFHFETRELIFEKDVKYKGKLKFKGDTTNLNIPMLQDGEFKYLLIDINIIPDAKSINPKADQTGSLFLTLPLSYDEAKPLAHELAYSIAHRITFFESGEFNIHGGLVICERIPETPEEEKEIGDKPYAAEMHLEEVIEPPKFDSAIFAKKLYNSADIDLIAQHNTAKYSKHTIDKFLGFFKILESQCLSNQQKKTLEDCLKNNERLFMIFYSTFKFESLEHAKESFIKFIKSIVNARHRCAHLKENKTFGYVPFDPRIKDEVIPFIYALEILTYKLIINGSAYKK